MKKTLIMLLILLLFVVDLLADKWYNSYEKALLAVRNAEWAQVIGHLSESLRKKAKPRFQARTIGMEFIDYFPYYFLGLAHYRLGQFDEAATALERSLFFGESVKIAALARDINDMLQDSRQRLAKPGVAREPAVESRPPEVLEEKENKIGERFEPPVEVKGGHSGQVGPMYVSEKKSPEKKISTPSKPLGSEQLSAPADSLSSLKVVMNREAKVLLKTHNFDSAEGKYMALLQLEPGHPDAVAGLELIARVRIVVQINQGIRKYFEGDIVSADSLLLETLKNPLVEGLSLARLHQFLAIINAERHLKENDPGVAYLEKMRHHLLLAEKAGQRIDIDPRFFSPKLIDVVMEQADGR